MVNPISNSYQKAIADIELFSPAAMEEAEKYGVDNLDRASLLTYIRTKAKYDKQYFMDIVLPHRKEWDGKVYESPYFHKLIDEYYSSESDLVILLPRGHAKTTRVLVNVLHELIYRPGTDLLYISAEDLGALSIGKIRLELELNSFIRELYGPLSPRDDDSQEIRALRLKTWKQNLLELANGSSIETVTKGGTIRGRRKHRVVVDDPEENKDVKNSKIAEAFKDFILTSVYNMMLPGRESMVVLGTMIGKRCLVKSLIDDEGRDNIKLRAIENGKPIRPELRSMEALDARRKKIGTKRFNQEFLHIPLSNEDSLVELNRIVQKPIAEYPKAWIRRLMCIDPAQKDKRKNDYSGFVHIGVAKGKKWILSSLQVKLKPLKLQAFAEHLYKVRGEPEYILKEDNIETTLTENLASKGYPIIGITVHKSKRERLLEVSPEIERGEVIFREEGDEELIKQLTEFPDVANDDVMDAATLWIKYCMEVNNDSLYIIEQ